MGVILADDLILGYPCLGETCAAGQIRGMVGISEDARNLSQKAFGLAVAAAAIALIFDKHTTGEVKSPGGYLRGMVEKAKISELHLDRSFYGRLSGRVSCRHASSDA